MLSPRASVVFPPNICLLARIISFLGLVVAESWIDAFESTVSTLRGNETHAMWMANSTDKSCSENSARREATSIQHRDKIATAITATLNSESVISCGSFALGILQFANLAQWIH